MVTETFERLSELRSKMKPGELIIQLKEAKHIGGYDFLCFGKADVYAVFSIGGEKRKSKVVQNGGSHPVWAEEIRFKIAEHVKLELYNKLHVFLYDGDVSNGSPRGRVQVDIESLLHQYENNVPYRKYPVIHRGKHRGTLELALSFVPSTRKARKISSTKL